MEGALCAAVRKSGISGKGVDSKVQSTVRCPVVPLNLSTPQGLKLMLDILRLQPVAALHLTPPLHSWSNTHQHCAAVITASVEIINQCCELGILWSISGPAATKLWPPALLQTVLDAGARQTLLDLCMFGAGWKLPTAIFSSYSSLCALGVSCSADHSHGARFQTNVSLPPLFCAAFVECLLKQLFDLGVRAPARSLPNQHISLSRAAALMVGKQLRGKRLKPLVPEFRQLVTLSGPPQVLPLGKLASVWESPNESVLQHPCQLPTGSKCIRSVPTSGGHVQNLPAASVECTYGIPWTPAEFCSEALKLGHPKRLECGVPDPLKAVLDKIVSTSYADIAKDRTQAMRKWLLRAQELRDVDPPFETPQHCREVLKNKSMTLFAEMLTEADYPDKTLVRTMCSGFDLLAKSLNLPCSPRSTLTLCSPLKRSDL